MPADGITHLGAVFAFGSCFCLICPACCGRCHKIFLQLQLQLAFLQDCQLGIFQVLQKLEVLHLLEGMTQVNGLLRVQLNRSLECTSLRPTIRQQGLRFPSHPLKARMPRSGSSAELPPTFLSTCWIAFPQSTR